jgi:hypothetical protein
VIIDDEKQICILAAMTEDLLALAAWLLREGCTRVAIENRGLYNRHTFSSSNVQRAS